MDSGLISQNAVSHESPTLSTPIPADDHHNMYIIIFIMAFYSLGSWSPWVSKIWEQEMDLK